MTAKIRFGFGFDMRNPVAWRRPWTQHYQEHLDFIAWTETLGFEQVWIAEHHCDEDGYCPSPLVVCSALAGKTKTMRLSTGIGLAPFYTPTRLAEDVAVLDIISGGRIELALGLGYLIREFDAYGVDVKSRGRRANEILEIIRPLWRGEEVTYHGEYYRLDKARIFPLPVQDHIPVYIGGAVKAGYRRAAKYGDGYFGPAESIPEYIEAVRESGAGEEAARVALIGTADSWVIVSDDPEKAMAEVAPHFYYQYNVYAKWLEGEGDFVLPKLELDQFKESGILNVLTPEQAIAHIRTRTDAWPLDSYCLQAPAGLPMDKFAPYVETFAHKVLPAFR